jgi:site-specific DNA-methyltransferase (adenine-specific)
MPRLVTHLRELKTYLYARIIWEKDDPWANSSHVSFHSKIQHAEYRVLPAWEYVFVFRKGEKARSDDNVNGDRWISKDSWKKLVHGVWKIRSVQQNRFHEAMFPEQLVHDCIRMYSFPGDLVLDPFMGSGSVAVAAKKLERNYIGYDLNEEYVSHAIRRIEAAGSVVIKQEPYRDKTVNRVLQEDCFDELPV